MIENAQWVRFLLGMLIVMATAGMAFNRPTWTRTYTCLARYITAVLIFVGCQVLIYYFFSIVGRYVVRSLLPAETLFAVSSPTLISAALTILVAQHSLIDPTLRNKLHTFAGVPEVALRLTQTLIEVPSRASDEQQQEAKALLLRRGIDCDQDWLLPADDSHQLSLKATVSFLRIREWEEKTQFRNFMSKVRHDFDRLRERFDRLSLKFSRTIGQIERLGDIKRSTVLLGDREQVPFVTNSTQQNENDNIDDKLKKVIHDMLLDLHDDVAAFNRAVCRMLASVPSH